jgi:hypothetical protein
MYMPTQKNHRLTDHKPLDTIPNAISGHIMNQLKNKTHTDHQHIIECLQPQQLPEPQ